MTIAWAELGTILRSFGNCRRSLTAGPRSAARRIGRGSRQSHSGSGEATGFPCRGIVEGVSAEFAG